MSVVIGFSDVTKLSAINDSTGWFRFSACLVQVRCTILHYAMVVKLRTASWRLPFASPWRYHFGW